MDSTFDPNMASSALSIEMQNTRHILWNYSLTVLLLVPLSGKSANPERLNFPPHGKYISRTSFHWKAVGEIETLREVYIAEFAPL